ncbi:rRNA N6-adenosine-methyltransferase ZCCHC4-like isoform X1 [Octopus vulgaris]|uniref:rRNA N6-adenosine-methyltransferase ZCCHC4-like isoform X1 n=2 Tax=Octopus vulgaris TaxID=6645 RepID=A0AA36AMK0_OCTVU|nr:rRNA N6-adenosine-methyltransferase ZCCHC4-like isoform X1 [Octopus vulgaris]
MAANVNNNDVILDSNAANAPHCAHGPTLLFVRYISGGKSSKRFYACSACRDRKDCNFYQLEDEKISEAKLKRREEFNKSQQPPFTHENYQQRLQRFCESPVESRCYCIDCQLLLLPTEIKQHQQNSHKLKKNITDKMLSNPTQLFPPYQSNKVYAQYHFSRRTLDLLKTTFEHQNITHTLCVGVPSLHEAIQNEKNCKIKSLLLDLDHRYMQVYSDEKFCRYNMFNNYFFNNTTAFENYQRFIAEEDATKKLAVVFDPPFGCMIEVLAHSYNNLLKQWQSLSKKTSESVLPAIIILPYFMEKRVQDSFTGFFMLDYKISYTNHRQFTEEHSDKKSTVRIFTNIERHLIHLPENEGYWYCDICCCYSSPENKHCNKCGSCTSKDGKTYVHCDKCARCVKPNRVHCDICQICQTNGHQCNVKSMKSGCHICGDLTHKRKVCPQNQSNILNKRKQKISNEATNCKKKKRKLKP